MTSPIIKNAFVKLNSPANAGARPGAAAHERAHGRRSARLVEIDGAVRAVEITCPCGETTLVEFAFEEKPRVNGGA
jgi:hypothetical protein